MVQILDIIHRTGRKNRLHKARNYLFDFRFNIYIYLYLLSLLNLLILILSISKKLVQEDQSNEDDNDHDDVGRHQDERKMNLWDRMINCSFFACLLFSLVTLTVGFAWFVQQIILQE